MAYYEDASISHVLTTDALFRAYVQKIQAGLAAVGLTQTADTGQINSTTVTIPAAGSYGGYEIWRFNDATGGTDPIYFKIEYGRAGGGGNTPLLRVTVGTGSNGSGTITNASSARVNQGNDAGFGNGRIYISMHDSSLLIFSNPYPTSTVECICHMIERPRKRDNSIVTGEITFLCATSSWVATALANTMSVNYYGSGAWDTSAGLVGCDGTPVESGTLVLGHLRILKLPRLPIKALLFCLSTSLAAEDAGNVTIGGVARQYKKLAGSAAAPSVLRSGGSGTQQFVVPNVA